MIGLKRRRILDSFFNVVFQSDAEIFLFAAGAAPAPVGAF